MSLARERRRRQTINVALSVLVVVISVAIGGLLVLTAGSNPIQAYGTLLSSTFGNWDKIVYTLSQSGPLIIVSLGLVLAFKGSFWNGGGEGQMLIGGIMGIIATYLAKVQFAPLALAVGFAAAFLGAGIWAAVSGALKVWFKVDDIV